MKMVCVAIYDVKAEAFMRPFFVQRKALAVRSFQDEVNRPAEDNPLYRHPADYRLMALGEWDDESGYFESLPRPELIIEAANVRKEV